MVNPDPSPLTPVAGNGLLDRRLFLTSSFKTIGAVALGGTVPAVNAALPNEPWMRTAGNPFSNYGGPSTHESALIRWVSAAPGIPQNGVSWTPLHELDGTITPSGLHFERHHNGVP